MSTRRASTADQAPTADERFMSKAEFVERRALPGNLVAGKAMLYPDRRHREMLYWLQSVTLKPGGLKQLARDIVTQFPDRLGSPTMHAHGIAPGVTFGKEAMERIEEELRLDDRSRQIAKLQFGAWLANGFEDGSPESKALRAPQNSAEYLLARCRMDALNELPDFLRDCCLDPDIDLEELEAGASAPFFADIYGALTHFKTLAEKEDDHAVTTSIGALVNETLDHALRTRGMVVIEGKEGSGKTTAVQAWARRHPAQVRYITLSGITHRTGFFQKVAEAIGLATCQRKSHELQAKIESFFGAAQLMLVIDKAHHAWPKAMRVQSAPEIIDWINTALVNQGVPVALVCTDQFSRLKERVERQTGWTSGQFLHRVKRFKTLPERPEEADLWAVARALLPMIWSESAGAWIHHNGERKPDERAMKAIVGYALTSNFPLPAVRDSVNEARDLAHLAGRDFVTMEDVRCGILEHQAPSDAAMKQAFAPESERRRSAPAKPASRIRVSSAVAAADEPPTVRIRLPQGEHSTQLPPRRDPRVSALGIARQSQHVHA